MRRCDHKGSACLHRPYYPPQAVRMDEIPPITWREVGEIVAGLVVFSLCLFAIVMWGAIAAVQM